MASGSSSNPFDPKHLNHATISEAGLIPAAGHDPPHIPPSPGLAPVLDGIDNWIENGPVLAAENSDDTDGVDDVFDVDSAYDGDSSRESETQTLASFITDYHWENGRRYHAYKDGAYWGPNDESSQDMQDLAHHLYYLTIGEKLHLAPITNPHNVLDLGTGTGIWAIQMAEQYPSAHVIGTDLSPIQPDFVPPNCNFEVEDVTLEWTYPLNKFDFIHIRELFGSVPDWSFLLGEVYRCTKPGGWVEICEHAVEPRTQKPNPDPDPKSTEAFYNLWGQTVISMGDKFGKTFNIWKESKHLLEEAGFVDVVEHRFVWPMNGWPKDPHLKTLGLWNQLRLYDGVEGFMLRLLTNVGGWSYERAQVFLAEMRAALKDHDCHAMLDVSVVYGRKPS